MRTLIGFAILLCLACGSSSTANKTEQRLRSWVGKTISQYIEERHYFPDSESPLPNGGKVYRFSTGSGGRVYESGDITSNVCRWWFETDSSGVITHWRFDNCK